MAQACTRLVEAVLAVARVEAAADKSPAYCPAESRSRASERFWLDGLGLDVLFRADDPADGGHALLMVGWPGAAWHLELVGDPDGATPVTPTEEDLLVLYLDGVIDDDVVSRLIDAGGTRVAARNPYWERRGATIADPDGYRLVVSSRSWL